MCVVLQARAQPAPPPLPSPAHGVLACRPLPWPGPQDCLGGNAKTLVIANINPAAACASETSMTLGFAVRAKRVRNRVRPPPTLPPAQYSTVRGHMPGHLGGRLRACACGGMGVGSGVSPCPWR